MQSKQVTNMAMLTGNKMFSNWRNVAFVVRWLQMAVSSDPEGGGAAYVGPTAGIFGLF
jgi:hypothetical protein